MEKQLALPPISGPTEDFTLVSESWIAGEGKYVRIGTNKKGDFKIQYCELKEDQVTRNDSYIPANLAPAVIRTLVGELLTQMDRERNAG